MTEQDLAAHADAGYFDWWRVWASSVEGGEVREGDGMLNAATGAPQEWWNVAFVTRPLTDPAERIREAVSFFDERSQPFIMRIREGLDPASERAMEQQGMPYTDTIPGMVLDPVPPDGERHASLEIRRVGDGAALDHHVRIIAEAFHMEPELVDKLVPIELIEYPHWRSYVGYADGEPAATSALLITDGLAGVHWVGTREAFGRRGFGEAMTCHALREGAAAGCRVATLQSSDIALPIYERMGFRLVAGYRTFVRPEFSGQ
jgi:ribosomal protein S18 acetylase RimI-like enzyme